VEELGRNYKAGDLESGGPEKLLQAAPRQSKQMNKAKEGRLTKGRNG